MSVVDMDPEEFRKHGRATVDWIADFLSGRDTTPVGAGTEPGEIREILPAAPPETGEPMERILADVDLLLPGMTHWNHPRFFGYFCSSGTGAGILGELLTAAFNVNTMSWLACPAGSELEEVTVDWVRQLLGLPERFRGVLFEGGSTSNHHALAAARESRDRWSIRERGLAGRAEVPRLRVYASEYAHSSVEKAAIALGLGRAGLRKIPVDREFRLRTEALASAIEEDRDTGWAPIAVVASVGTTSCGSLDPVPEIARICRDQNLWLHVDAAWAGSYAIAGERPVLAGCERADSLVVNPHKNLLVPLDASLLFVRDPSMLERAFALTPAYLEDVAAHPTEDYMSYGLSLGRRFRALKLWFVLRYFGREGLATRLRHQATLAKRFADWVDADPDFERLAPVSLGLVCFRARQGSGVNEFNRLLLKEIQATREVFLTHAELSGELALRLAVGHVGTELSHVERAWEVIRDVRKSLGSGPA